MSMEPEAPRIIVDTSVLVAGLRSRRGAAFRLLTEVGKTSFEIALSVPLVLEYEDVLLRHAEKMGLAADDIDALLDYFCRVAHLQRIFFLWRPLLPDPKDDLVLEVAVAAECEAIVTYNVRHFAGAERFGIQVLEPGPFLRGIGVLK
jgi:putative PIN family toxin of toxin-antitoxin system